MSDLLVVLPLAVAISAYCLGVAKLWLRAGMGRGIGVAHVASFTLGWVVLALALVSPLHTLGGRLFTAHMIQHELLMAVAAPLVVLGRPGGAFSWALPAGWRGGIAPAIHNRAIAGLWHALTRPLLATVLHGLAIWAWHMPALFEAALEREWIHWLEHASLLGTSLMFWWAVLGRVGIMGYGVSLACLFATALHSSLLGTLLTFSPRPWYGPAPAASRWGLTGIEDQQLAGLIMWVPGGLVYAIAALALAAFWITESGKRAAGADAVIR
jgi:cytochrome c oxidase assembly factor CtaG